MVTVIAPESNGKVTVKNIGFNIATKEAPNLKPKVIELNGTPNQTVDYGDNQNTICLVNNTENF